MDHDGTAPFLTSHEQRRQFVRAFEEGSLPEAEWTHAAHVAVATVYLLRYGVTVLAATRKAIRHYLVSRGKPLSAYHETLTAFWLAVIQQSLQAHPVASEEEAVAYTHQLFGACSKVYAEFYSFDVVGSAEARAAWVAPDLKPLPVQFELGGGSPDAIHKDC